LLKLKKKKKELDRAPVAHACNPSYSGGRGPISKKTKFITKKRAGGVVQGVGPEFKSQYCKKRTQNKGKPVNFKYMQAAHFCSGGV
jgi:hypothetical protein